MNKTILLFVITLSK